MTAEVPMKIHLGGVKTGSGGKSYRTSEVYHTMSVAQQQFMQQAIQLIEQNHSVEVSGMQSRCNPTWFS